MNIHTKLLTICLIGIVTACLSFGTAEAQTAAQVRSEMQRKINELHTAIKSLIVLVYAVDKKVEVMSKTQDRQTELSIKFDKRINQSIKDLKQQIDSLRKAQGTRE